jgi:hypothetical protein
MLRRGTLVLTLVMGTTFAVACSPRAQIGTDLFWVSTFETGTFAEWSGEPGGSANADPAPNAIEVSSEHIHRGRLAAKLTISAPVNGVQANTLLRRRGDLPQSAYYSAWYYLPDNVRVGVFWTIFKLRRRYVAADPTSEDELYDVNLETLPTGELALWVYDHRVAGRIPLDVPEPVVPIGRWFQVETYFRNAQDTTGRATLWFDGAQIVDVTGAPMGPTPWVEWDAVSVAVGLSPSLATLFVDDAAISRTRVGPDGVLGD